MTGDGSRLIKDTRLGIDIMLLATMLPLAVLSLGLGPYFLIDPYGLSPDGTPKTPPPFDSTVLIFVAFGIWLATKGFAALLRALERGPLLVADETGVTFHRTFFLGHVPWSEIRWVRITGLRRPYALSFGLKRWFWSVECPWGSRRVSISQLHIDGQITPYALAEELEAMRKAAAITRPS